MFAESLIPYVSISQVNHNQKLYEALQTEKISIEQDNAALLENNGALKEDLRTAELELVVAKKDVSTIFQCPP